MKPLHASTSSRPDFSSSQMLRICSDSASRTRRRMPLVCSASIGLLAVLHGLPASAQNGTWTALTGGDATGLWSDTASWGGGVIANGPGNTAFFNTLDITFPSIIRLDSARAIGSLIFGDTDTNTGANWTLDNNGNAANILTLAGAAPTISFGPTNAANRLTISTVLAGTAGLTYAGSGTILMTGNVGHTYTGGTILTGRVETTNVANAALTVFGAAVAANTLTFDGGYFQIFNTTGATSAGSLVNDLIVNTTGTLEMSGRSFTSGTLTGNGTFNVITHFVRSQFDGNWNAFTGTVNVTSGDAGVSDFRWSNYNGFANAILNLGTNTNTYFTPNQTNTAVPFAGTNLSIGALSGVSSATLRGGPIAGRVTNFLIGAKNVDTDFAGAIAEQTAGALTDILKQGTGTLTLSGGASAYNGPTRVDAGTLAVAVLADGGAVSSIGQSSNAAASLLLNGGTFKYIGTGHSTNRLMTIGTTSPVTLNASGIGAVNFTNTGALVLTGAGVARTIGFAGSSTDDNTFSPVIPDNGAGLTSVAKSGTGTWVPAGANTYTGATSITGGILKVGSLANGGLPSSIGASSNAAANLVIDGGTLRYTGAGTVTDRALTAGIGGATLDASGTGALVFNSPAATALTGTDTARTITLTGTSTGGNTLAATIGNNGAGATTLSKTGAGRWIVSGANTYSGGTTITNGVLSVQNTSGSGTGTGPVTASTGGTLGGTGTIGGAVTINSGGRLAPGASVGTLTVGSLSLATGAILDYEFSVGPANDLLVVSNSGGLTLNSAAFNLFAAGTANTWSNTGTYNLIQYSGAIGGIGLDATWTTVSATNPHILNPAGGRTYGFGASGGFITLTISTTANLSTWNVNAGGSWGAAGNWTAGIPNGASDTANFLNAPNSPQTILLDGSKTVGSLQFANPNVSSPINAYTIGQGSGGSLILDNGAAPAQITVVGSDLISAPVSLVSSAVVDVDAVADTLTISGAISGAALSKSGNGTLTLTAPNSHSATSLQGGAINVGNPAALGAGALTFSGNGTLVAGVGSLVLANNAVIGNGVTATINPQATTLTLAGIISNTNANGALRKTGPGTLVLSGANTYGGATTLEGGTLSVSALANGGLASNLGQSSSAAANLVLNGATLAYTGAATTTDRLFTIGTAGGTLDASGTGALELTNVGALALAGTGIARTLTLGGTSLDDNRLAPSIGDNLTGATSLSKTGPGTWILASANSFTGATVISGGILAVGHPLALQNSTLDYNSHGGSLAFRTVTAATLGNLNGGQNLDLNNELGQAVALTVGNAQNSFYAGQLSDGFAFGSSLTKIGNGSLTLSGANSYAGATTLNAGLLQLAPGGVIAGSGVQINSNATLTVSGGSLTASGTGNLNSATGGVAFNLTSGSATFNAGLNALANANQNWVINATGGTLTTSSMSFGRSALVNAAEPAAGVTGTGLYINGAAVHVTGALTMGTTAGANSAVNARIDSGSLLVDGPVTIGLNNGGRWSIIDVNGGTFTSTDPFGGVFIGGPLVGNAKFLVRAGTATAELIRMGQAASGTSVIELTGGSLYVGSGGIVQNSAVLSIIKLAGGTLGAKDTWTSPIDMQVNGNPTIKAADAVGAAHDITLGGALSGGGTLTKTGAGILTLSGSQLYAVLYAAEGTTNVTGSFTTGASIVNVDARLNFSASQTLSDLNIGAGATVTLTASPSPEEGFALANEMSAQGASPASQITAVPEPGALGMLAFGALGILARRRRA